MWLRFAYFEWLRPISRIIWFPCLCSLFCCGTGAQNLIAGPDLPEAVRILDASLSKNTLPCQMMLPRHPHLDFMLRYVEPVWLECSGGRVVHPGSKLYAFMRITPERRPPILMMKEFEIPAVPRGQTSNLYLRPLQRFHASMSGGFAMGRGQYLVEVALTDRAGHAFRKQRRLEAGREKGAESVSVSLRPGEISPLENIRLISPRVEDGPEVTVLLHAYSQGRSRIEDWDRAYLLESVATVLRQIPCRSVRLIAFNLDKQDEVFRDDHFDGNGFVKLEKALAGEDLAAVPYQALRPNTWAEFLVDMTATEAMGERSPDAIIFLGAWGSHEWDTVPREMITKLEKSNARIFYLKYFAYPGGALDGVERLTRDLHGSVFEVYSPLMLQRAINKMNARISTAAE